jgi:hypothetical protein
MQGYSSSFPRASAGAGLLLLRFAVAVQLLFNGAGMPPWWQLTLLAILAVLLGLGLLTPLAGLLGALYQVLCACATTTLTEASLPAIAAATALALVLTGPGGYSADARLFGRRRLVLSPGATKRDGF